MRLVADKVKGSTWWDDESTMPESQLLLSASVQRPVTMRWSTEKALRGPDSYLKNQFGLRLAGSYVDGIRGSLQQHQQAREGETSKAVSAQADTPDWKEVWKKTKLEGGKVRLLGPSFSDGFSLRPSRQCVGLR